MVDTTGVACTATNVPAGCNPTFAKHIAAVCDVGNGVCRPDTSGNGKTPVLPGAVTVLVEQDPFPPSKLAINVFEDDFPLNGEQDAGGGVDVIALLEAGLGGFNIVLWDDIGGSGDVTGQMTYDMFTSLSPTAWMERSIQSQD
jgi:hypothetical protein